MPPYEPLPLARYNNSFIISALFFECALAHVDPRAIPRREQLTIQTPTGTVVPGADAGETTAFAPDVIDAVALAVARSRSTTGLVRGQTGAGLGDEALPPELARLSAFYQQYRNAWTQCRHVFTEVVRQTPAARRPALFEWVRSSLGGIDNEPEFQQIAAAHASPGSPDPAATRRAEVAALKGLQTLASLYVKQRRPPATDGEVVQFLSKVRDTLDVFLHAFIPLRDGQRQFASQLNLGRRPAHPDMHEMAAAYGVESARDPAELARWLLDWSDEYASGHQALEGAFADLMIHQMAMLNGVMRGVKALLHELSPATLESALQQGRANGTGWTIGPFRYRALWHLFRTRHADIDEGERHVFTLLFGGDFVQAYSQMMDEATTDEKGQGRRGPLAA